MKAFICCFAILLFVVQSEQRINSFSKTSAKRGYDVVRRLMPADRRFGSGDSASAVQCITDCYMQVSQTVMTESPAFTQRLQGNTSNVNSADLDAVCRIHNLTSSCINRCAASSVKQMVVKGLAVTQYACYDSTFRRDFPCIDRVWNENEATCSAQNKCGALENQIEASMAANPSDMASLKDAMKKICLYVKCALECGDQPITSKCGMDAQDSLEGVVSRSVDALKLIFQTIGMGQGYASECDRLIV